MKKIRVNQKAYYDYVSKRESKTILVFCPETYNKENHLNVRVFPIFYGVQEDPATGSGNGCLAAYLVKNAYFGREEIDNGKGRAGLRGLEALTTFVEIKGSFSSGKISVEVGGSAVVVAEGRLLLIILH